MWLAQAKIEAGLVGSGTRVISSYILADVFGQMREMGIASEVVQQVYDSTPTEGLALLESGEVDVVFWIAGAPLKVVADLVENVVANEGGSEDLDIRLMSIDASLVASLNQDYGLSLRPTNFTAKYFTQQPVATLGSWAFLVTNRVPTSDVQEILELLWTNRSETEADLEGERVYQLDEFNFLGLLHGR